MSVWDAYPANYRAAEVQAIRAAVKAGECVAVVGLSGAGKSNLLGYLAARQPDDGSPRYVLVDSNRLSEHSAAAYLGLMHLALAQAWPGTASAPIELDALASLEVALAPRLAAGVAFLLDLSQLIDRDGRLLEWRAPALWGNLRALRDRCKFDLTYVLAVRHPLPHDNELAELFFGHTVWLGPLAEADARWTVLSYAERAGCHWETAQVDAILAVTGRYPALLRGACEACAAGAAPTVEALGQHPAVAARLEEFWVDRPEPAELRAAGLESIALLNAARPLILDTAGLTAKENRLLQALQSRPGEVCEKDDLIRAVWPEDKVFESGVRDDSLAQLVRRLREKVEPDAGAPRYILTVPGRGYRFVRRVTGAS